MFFDLRLNFLFLLCLLDLLRLRSRFRLYRPGLSHRSRLVQNAGTGDGEVPDQGLFRPVYREFFAVQDKFQSSNTSITEQEPLIGAPSKTFPPFEHGLFLRAVIGPDQEPGIFDCNDFEIQLFLLYALSRHGFSRQDSRYRRTSRLLNIF